MTMMMMMMMTTNVFQARRLVSPSRIMAVMTLVCGAQPVNSAGQFLDTCYRLRRKCDDNDDDDDDDDDVNGDRT